jgi:hypothetical protein
MKRLPYIVLLCALLAGAVANVQGQAPGGRTANTIVADVLAQMPATDGERFDELMRDLVSTGEEGVLQLVGMMTAPGRGSNARVEYALSGLSHRVSAPGREAQRIAVSNAYVKALAAASDREVKAFIIRELQLIGGVEAVPALTALLGDGSLGEPARAALASISGNAPPLRGEPAPYAARTLALSEEMKANPAKALKLLQKALKAGDRKYRFAAMEIASPYADGAMYAALVGKTLPKAKPEVRTDILNWLGDECNLPGRREIIAPIVGDAAVGLLSAGDADLTGAAAGLLSKTGGSDAITALAALLGSEDPAIVDIAAAALLSTKGDIASAVAPLVSTAGDAGKIAALKLLAGRRSTANSSVVFSQLTASSPRVQDAAYTALKEVVSKDDQVKLCTLLENAPSQQIAPLQQAVSSALHTLPAAEQYAAVLARMNGATPAKQYLYYPVLASTGDDKALALIVERFGKETGAAKDAAFGALVGWRGMNAADQLLKISQNPAESPYFDRAITRYTNLVAGSTLSGEDRRERLAGALDVAATAPQKNVILKALGATNSFPGMMKAGEYLDDKATRQAAAGAVMAVALGNPQFTGDNVRALLEKVITVLDNPDADYERQAIRKHLSEMADVEPFELSDEEKREGFTVLFDGRDLDSWTGNKEDYRVQSGTISLYPSRSFGGNLYTAKEYGNFVFRFEFMLTPGANNGVGIRAERDKDAAYHGMEIQILDHDDAAYRNITPLQVHGSVYGVIGAKRAVLKPEGEWNVEEIMADGDHIRVTLNGEVILDGNIRDAARGGTADGHDHPGLLNKKGYIGFLGHGSELKFRNIRIKELP